MDDKEILTVQVSREDFELINKIIEKFYKHREKSREIYRKKKGNVKTYETVTTHYPTLRIVHNKCTSNS
jgi:hypothetical protein